MENRKGFTALIKYLQMSAHKIRPIAHHIRGRDYMEAMAILEAYPNKGAGFLAKALKSAASNAMNQNEDLDEESIIVKAVLINEGPSRKAIWPRGRGRADYLIKRSSHIFVEVAQKEGNV